MKYPQLVSTRAVNAISDWLVSRLEQIGVEAPLIYSRLLLSLLHSSVQINEPIEFSNLEKYFANQKGNKRFPPCDSETIKKFTAIQCLLDAVSTEQEISCIEKLVDELFEKLIDLENQAKEEDYSHIEDHHHHHQLSATIKSLDVEDPRKRYYRAFPALSKEMEDSVLLASSNEKSKTWPTGNSRTSSNNMVAFNNTAGVKRKNKRRRNQAINKGRANSARKNSYGGSISPTWDTDFEGNWEMGTDLYKEFLLSQNNRNRSISESDASSFRYEKNCEKRMKPTKNESINTQNNSSTDSETLLDNLTVANRYFSSNMASDENNLMYHMANKDEAIGNKIILKNDNLRNFISAGDTNDMDASVPFDDMTFRDMDCFGNINRQLYQDKIAHGVIEKPSPIEQQHKDIAEFEAKFNSSVEALWKDNINASITLQSAGENANQNNIENFWTNYYNHHYNSTLTEEKYAPPFSANKTAVTTRNDYYSLPSNMSNFPKGGDIGLEKTLDGKELSSVGVFINDSIWSDNAPVVKKENNEAANSFYSNCWPTKDNQQGTDTCDGKTISNPFNMSKWSECSFETPFVPSSVASNAPTNVGLTVAKNLYSGNYKQQGAATASKLSGANSLFQHNSQQELPSQPDSLPEYGQSLRTFVNEKCQLASAAAGVSLIASQQHQSVSATSSSTTTTTNTTARTVSLTNHSKTSGFIEYSIVKSSSSLFQLPSSLKSDRNTNPPSNSQGTMPLASSSQSSLPPPPGLGESSTGSTTAATVVNSSASSSSPLEDEENLLTSFRTHFRPIKQSYADGHEFDITGTPDDVDFERSDSGGLYVDSEKYGEYTRVDNFLSDEDSTSSAYSFNGESKYRDVGRVSIVKGLYPLKFRVKQVDKGCQTIDWNLVRKTPKGTNNSSLVLISAKKRIVKCEILSNDDGGHDEVDCCADSDCYLTEEATIDLEKWTMAEIGKKCADNNNSHTLWGMCSTCTKENKCVPANRLLKDELTVEADEIMSDLKYMQDLYIYSDWENDDDDNDTDSELEALKDDDDSRLFGNVNSTDDDDDDEEQEQIFYNITKLISDLLKPENAQSLVSALNASAANTNVFRGTYSGEETSSVDNDDASNANNASLMLDNQESEPSRIMNNNNERYIGGLWSNDENIIWTREMMPLNSGSRLTDNKTDSFLEKLNWKHANLAAIWRNGPPSDASEIEISSSSSSSDGSKSLQYVNSASTLTSHSSEDTNNQSLSHLSLLADDHVEPRTTTMMNIRNIENTFLSPSRDRKNVANLLQQRLPPSQQANCCLKSSTEIAANRPDRKRRHSASQNMVCSGDCGGDIGGRIALEWSESNPQEMSAKMSSCNKVGIMAKWESDCGKFSSMMHADDSLSSSSLSPKTTIITCKYWTTMDTTLASPYFLDKSSHYDGIGAMALNPSSIFRHVSVVSRPLTR